MGRLSSVVQAVEFEIQVPGIGAARCLISAELLRERFGADEAPTSWLVAFTRHRAEIEQAARAARHASSVIVILNESSFDLAC